MDRDAPGEQKISVLRAEHAHAAEALTLVEEYQQSIGIVVRDHRADIFAYLNSADKALWIAYLDTAPVGCVAFRTLQQPKHAGEMKRLYVRKDSRGLGIARHLVLAIEEHARRCGCSALLLDTKDDLADALRFYERMGYVRRARYNDNPQATIFMQKDLVAPS